MRGCRLGWVTLSFFSVRRCFFPRWVCAHALFCDGVWGLSGVSHAVCGAQVWDAPGVVRAAGGHLVVESLRLWRAAAGPFLAMTCASPLYVLLAT